MNLNRPLLLIAVLCVLLFGALALAWQRHESRPPPAQVVVIPVPASTATPSERGTPPTATTSPSVRNAASAAAHAPRTVDPAREFDLTLGGALKLDGQTRGDVEALLNALPIDASRDELARVRGELRAHLPPDDAEKADLLLLAYRVHVTGLLREELGPNAPAVPPSGR